MQRIRAIGSAGMRVVIVTIALTLAACGGGGGGGSPTPPTPPTPPAPNPPATVAPTIVTQPSNQSIDDGESASFAVTASGTAPLSYQWRRNDVDIAGATSDSYAITGTYPADNGAQFTVVVTNSAGSAGSSAASLSVAPVAPTIATQPLAQRIAVGSSATFSVTASGTAPLTYSWRRNDTLIPSADSATLVVSPVTGSNDEDRYTVTVTNAGGSATSAAATLWVEFQSGIDLAAGLIGGSGNVDGTGGNAHFKGPADVAVDGAGNLFVVDNGNSTVRRTTPTGVTTTLAGVAGERDYVDAVGVDARFRAIHAIAVDTHGNVFVADSNAIRRIASDGTVTTVAGVEANGYADGIGTSARFHLLAGPRRGQLTVAPNGDLFVADCGNHVIRRVTPAGDVSTYAGSAGQSGTDDGDLDDARFNCPSALVFGADDALYVAEHGVSARAIRKIDADVVSTVVASGFTSLVDLTADNAGNLFAIDSRTIKRVNPDWTTISVVGSGSNPVRDGTGTTAGLGSPQGIGIDGAGNLYVADSTANAIRKISPAYVVSTLPSSLGESGYTGYANGTASAALFNTPIRVTADDDGTIYVADSMNCAIRAIDGANVVSTLVGAPDGCNSTPAIYQPRAVTFDGETLYAATYPDGYVVAISNAGVLTPVAGAPGTSGFQDGLGSAARFSSITGLATDADGNIYVSDSGNNSIRKIDIATSEVTTLAGNPLSGWADGLGTAAQFNGPCGVEADGAGNVYVADCGNHAIRKIAPNGSVTTIAGIPLASGYIDGDALAARFFVPTDLALDNDGNLYVADQANYMIRKISAAGTVSTVAGAPRKQGQALGPLPASMNAPFGIHARNVSATQVELIVTAGNAVVRITLP